MFNNIVPYTFPGVIQLGSMLSYLKILQDGNTILSVDAFNEDAFTFTTDENGKLRPSSWDDEFGLNNDLLQPTLTKQPIYNDGSVIFDSVDDFMEAAYASAKTQPLFYYAVIRQDAWVANMCLWDGNEASQLIMMQNGTSPGLKAHSGSYSPENSGLLIGKWGILRVLYNGLNSKFITNDDTPKTGDFGTDQSTGFCLGSQSGTHGWSAISVRCMIIRSGVPTEIEESAIYNGLRKKYFTYDLIALTGASNTIGYYPEDVLPADYAGNQERISIYFEPLTGTAFQKMNPAINSGYDWIVDPDDNTGWGIEQTAAHKLKDQNKNTVLVVKSGQNGGVIADWANGMSAFENLKSGLLEAINNIDYHTLNVKSICFGSPASDAIDGKTTEYVEALTRDLFVRIRAIHSRLSNIQIVVIKLIDSMTGFGLTPSKIAQINAAYDNIAATMPNIVIINPDDISGIELRGDNIHYTAASQMLLGDAWKAVMP